MYDGDERWKRRGHTIKFILVEREREPLAMHIDRERGWPKLQHIEQIVLQLAARCAIVQLNTDGIVYLAMLYC